MTDTSKFLSQLGYANHRKQLGLPGATRRGSESYQVGPPGPRHPACFDTIKRKNIKYDAENPRTTAKLVYETCGCLIDEHHKTDMLARGEWRATAVSQNGTRGYHLSGLYSPLGWKAWGDCAAE